jgi:Recombinase/Recombinase zinc beta ribbon domain
VAAILKNPAYAGAFVYGRTRIRETTREGASRAKTPRPIEEWRIVVKDRYPAYIDWQTYERIRAAIRDNRAEYMRTKTRGTPRDGDLLLHGITWCARCGHKMYVRYKGGGEYVCNHLRTSQGLPTCQHIRAARIDAAVAGAFLTALAPAELDALSRARRAQQQVDIALRASADRQLERKRYAAALAERQFNKVDPDKSSCRCRARTPVGGSSERGPGSWGSTLQASASPDDRTYGNGQGTTREGSQSRRPAPTNLG